MTCDEDDITVWYKGATYEYTLTVTRDGQLLDLSSVTDLEVQVKARPGDPDPPLVSLALGSGVTLLDQTTNRGQASVVLPYDALLSLAAGYYYVDAWAVFPGTPEVRKPVIKPEPRDIRDAVNIP